MAKWIPYAQYKKKAISGNSEWQFMGSYNGSQSATEEMLFDIRQASRGTKNVSFKIDAKKEFSKEGGGYLTKFTLYHKT